MPFDGFIDMIDMIIYLKHFAYTQKKNAFVTSI